MAGFPQAQLEWRLSGNQSTTISGAGNSGNWGATPPQEYPSTPVSLGNFSDVTVVAVCTGVTASPTWTVFLDVYDSAGNLIPKVLSLTAITAANTPVWGTIGLHGSSAGSYMVLPSWGRVQWTLTGSGAAVTGAEISVWGR